MILAGFIGFDEFYDFQPVVFVALVDFNSNIQRHDFDYFTRYIYILYRFRFMCFYSFEWVLRV